MSHTINGFIASIDELQRSTTGLKSAKIARLDVEGYGFLPYTHDFSNEINDAFFEFARKAQKPIIHVQFVYFDGMAEQRAGYWENGINTFGFMKNGAINAALKLLGIKAIKDQDEFDTIGLGKFPTNDCWALKAVEDDDLEEKERLDSLRILDELRDNPMHQNEKTE